MGHPVSQLLLSAIIIWLIIISLFLPWWSFEQKETRRYGGDSYVLHQAYKLDYGLFSLSEKAFYSESTFNYIWIYYYDSIDRPQHVYFITSFAMVLAILTMMIVLHILFVLKYAVKSPRNVAIFFLMPLVLSAVVLCYFVIGFPSTLGYYGGFIGSNERIGLFSPGPIEATIGEHWGPQIGFFIFIVVFIILIMLNIPKVRSLIEKRKEKKKKKMTSGSSEKQDAS